MKVLDEAFLPRIVKCKMIEMRYKRTSLNHGSTTVYFTLLSHPKQTLPLGSFDSFFKVDSKHAPYSASTDDCIGRRNYSYYDRWLQDCGATLFRAGPWYNEVTIDVACAREEMSVLFLPPTNIHIAQTAHERLKNEKRGK